MIKRRLSKLVCMAITVSTVLSCGGQLLADEFSRPDENEDVYARESDDRFSDRDYVFDDDESEAEVEEDIYFEADDESESDWDVTDLSGTQTYEGSIDLSSLGYDYEGYELAEGYINQEMSFGREAKDQSYDYRGHLSKPNRVAFDYLYEHSSNVAAGLESYTLFTIPKSSLKFEFTASDLGISDLKSVSSRKLQTAIGNALEAKDYNSITVIDFMLFACPYELYWMDKTGYLNYYWDYDFNNSSSPTKVIVSNFRYVFPVAEEYQKNGNYLYMDTSYGKSVSKAVDNAKKIISSCNGLDDYNKLLTYATTICDLTNYNDKAAYDESIPYGNPWQMIWVFDGDSKTKVVCEGYSKAFQYLCDNTIFKSGKIYAICCYGDCGGPHMWNIVHMDDGKNYLVDTTNMDGGLDLFLKGGTPSSKSSLKNLLFYVTANGYSLPYRYDQFMVDYYGASGVALAPTDYVYKGGSNPTPAPVHKNEWVKDSSGHWFYYDAEGNMTTGWKKIGSAWYYFGTDGVMKTGWQKIQGYWYCFRSTGSMYSSTWLKWGNSWYYLKSNGQMATGWLKIDGSWYLFTNGGVMLTGWQKYNGSWYYLESNGAMKTGWLKSGKKWYYLSSSGAMLAGCFSKIGGYTYYFDSTGAMVTGTVTINGKKYTFDKNGHMIG